VQYIPTDKLNASIRIRTPRILKMNANFDPIRHITSRQLSNIMVDTIRDVKRSSNFRTSILKFEFDLHTFGIRSSDSNLDREALPVSRTLRYELLI